MKQEDGKRIRQIAFRIFMLSMLVAIFVLGSSTKAVYAKEGDLPEVDPTKGITYYMENDTIVGYNLNGNSVIIQTVENDGVKTCRMYIDKNKNGKVDTNESAARLAPADKPDGAATEELQMNYNIYGAVGVHVTDAYTITLLNANLKGEYIYGAKDSSLSSDLNINILGSTIDSGYVYGLYGDSTAAGDVNINLEATSDETDGTIGSVVNYIYGLYDVKATSAEETQITRVSGNLTINVD